jgi:hypothetical protein
MEFVVPGFGSQNRLVHPASDFSAQDSRHRTHETRKGDELGEAINLTNEPEARALLGGV